MPSFAVLSKQDLESWAGEVVSIVKDAASLESAAQRFATFLYDKLEGTCVLARLYATIPYGALPEFNARFAYDLASKQGVAHELRDETPVLSLMGSMGVEEEWRDRKRSQGHVGIPLTSSSFVGEIPMVARLLQEMGVGIQWLDGADAKVGDVTASSISGAFYVANASSDRDARGRHIIPAQDFVRRYGVESVFGSGGHYADGTIVVAVVFVNEFVREDNARRLQLLVDAFVTATSPVAKANTIF